MSLINQLLLDLEKRHASGPEMKSLAPLVRALPPRKSRRVWPMALLVAAGAAAVVYLLTVRDDEPVHLPQPLALAAIGDAPLAGEEGAQAALLVPVFQLADELSFVPETPPHVKTDTASPKPNAAATPPAPEKSAAAPTASKRDVPRPVPENSPPSPKRSSATAATSVIAPEMQEVTMPVRPEPAGGQIDKQMREPTAFERAELEFRKGVARLQQGRVTDAEAHFRAAMQEDLSHAPSRQALLGLLLDAGRNADAEKILRESIELNPRQPRHAMLLARLELERGDAAAAVWTLEATRPFAGGDPEYLAFLAVAMQRADRHEDAARFFSAALSGVPGNPVWLMGLGISLRALNEPAAAQQAFSRAAESRKLSAELQAYVEAQARDLAPRSR
jgi:MSHA biogenesis protein MshN